MNEKLTWTFAAVAAASGGAVFLTDRIEATADQQMKRILACVLIFWWVTCACAPYVIPPEPCLSMHAPLAGADRRRMEHAGLFCLCGW